MNKKTGRWERIKELYETGLSTTEIAKVVGITRQGVRHALKAMGVEMRPRGGSNGGGRR